MVTLNRLMLKGGFRWEIPASHCPPRRTAPRETIGRVRDTRLLARTFAVRPLFHSFIQPASQSVSQPPSGRLGPAFVELRNPDSSGGRAEGNDIES